MNSVQQKMIFSLTMNWNRFLLQFLQAGIIMRGDKPYRHDRSRTMAIVMSELDAISMGTGVSADVKGVHESFSVAVRFFSARFCVEGSR